MILICDEIKLCKIVSRKRYLKNNHFFQNEILIELFLKTNKKKKIIEIFYWRNLRKLLTKL